MLLEPVFGKELSGPGGAARRQVPALRQEDFPEPETGCGPAAMLNWLLWLEAQRALRFPREWTTAATPRQLYEAIETTLAEIRRESTPGKRGPMRTDELVAVMDRLVREYSDGALRLAPEVFEAPVKISDLITFNRGYRCGFLVGEVLDDEASDQSTLSHVVSLVAADRQGGVMLNNWGARVYGHLRNEAGQQVFRARNADHPPMRIDCVIRLIPFSPEAADGIAATAD